MPQYPKFTRLAYVTVSGRGLHTAMFTATQFSTLTWPAVCRVWSEKQGLSTVCCFVSAWPEPCYEHPAQCYAGSNVIPCGARAIMVY